MYFVHVETPNHSSLSLKKNILGILAYFDIFDYPLNEEEIRYFLHQSCTDKNLYTALMELVEEGLILTGGNFFMLKDSSRLVQRRMKGNELAQKQLKLAKKIGRFLFKFPFVRAIGISGSLSKNFADEKSDLDFFIITASGRLWIARTIMHFFKKLTFIVGRQHWFCMNYYVDEQALEIREKNIFTAIETATLVPVSGMNAFREFYLANLWVNSYFPNHAVAIQPHGKFRRGILKSFAEFLFSGKWGDKLEAKLMSVTTSRYDAKTERGKLNSRGIVMSMDADKHYAKPDPRNFQVKIIERYEKKLHELISRHDRLRNTEFTIPGSSFAKK